MTAMLDLSNDAIDALSQDEARALCASLVQERQRTVASSKEARQRLNRAQEGLCSEMPALATLLEATAERAGLAQLAQVRGVLHAIGALTYPQWSKGTPVLERLPADAVCVGDPTAHDARMVLASPLMDALDRYERTVAHAHGQLLPREARSLVEGIHTVVAQAARDALAGVGVTLRLDPASRAFCERTDAIVAMDIVEAIPALTSLLDDHAHDLHQIRLHLRGDLRMASLRAYEPVFYATWRIVERLQAFDPAITQQQDSTPF